MKKINSLKNIDENPELQYLLKLGIEHEMQHQELILMDIKKNLFSNPNPTFYNPLEKVKSTKIFLKLNSAAAKNLKKFINKKFILLKFIFKFK